MKKINQYTLFLAFSLMMLSACGILDQSSPDNVPADEVLSSADGLRTARGGMYSLLANENYYGGYYPLSLDAHSDNAVTGGYEVVSLDELGDKSLTPANLFVERMWISIYAVNNAANQILANVEKNTDLDAAERDNIKGEALFMRALTHFDALKMFGAHSNKNSEFGIPLVLTPQKPSDVVRRASVEATYKQIIKDLLDAEAFINGDAEKSNIYVTKNAARALIARVCLFDKDNANAFKFAEQIINDNKYSLFDATTFSKLYSERQTPESIFELKFDAQNKSAYNSLTYKRADALRPELGFMAAKKLGDFFKTRPSDIRNSTVDFSNNGADISPNGRSQKYRGESNQDNPAYILRFAEMYLIAAEAKGFPAGIGYLNVLRQKRGLSQLTQSQIVSESKFLEILLDERRAEFNMEGQRFVDLVRFSTEKAVLGDSIISAFPIPLREVAANKGELEQFPGY